MKKFSMAIVALSLLAGVLFLPARNGPKTQAQTQEDRLVWARVTGAHPTADLRNVFIWEKGRAWVVGAVEGEGASYHMGWLGSFWRVYSGELPDGVTALNAASFVSYDNLWAVGEHGLILHSGWPWTKVENPVPAANLLTLQMLGNGEEGWAGGYVTDTTTTDLKPVLLHYKDGRWQQDNSITGNGAIRSLHFAPDGGWAVGDVGIWRYRDGRWTKENEPAPCDTTQCVRLFNGVRAISGDEAWVVGSHSGTCDICVSKPYALHRVNGAWQPILPDQGIINDPTDPSTDYGLTSITFTDKDNGFAVGAVGLGDDAEAFITAYSNGRWVYVNPPEGSGALNNVSAWDATHVLAVGRNGTIVSYGYGLDKRPTPPPARLPTARIEDPHDPKLTYFPEVGHTLRSGFRDYWQAHGGLEQFGYPLTEEFTELSQTDNKPYTVQYFERARFEWHPENRPPYDVLLGLLGRTVTAFREFEPPFQPAQPKNDRGDVYFKETGHNLSAEFVDYWRTHGGLPVYGYPISEAFTETSPTDGKPYTVQYFERNRFEYHPELPGAYQVSLGLLGAEILKARSWLP